VVVTSAKQIFSAGGDLKADLRGRPGRRRGGDHTVIEAVFEDPTLKAQVYAEAQAVAPDALLASNTSALPITELAAGVAKPEDFVGMHFFSPVHKMPLVEIIKGEKSSPEAVARTIDVVQQLRKTPIVVNDGRCFFTSRVYGTLLTEATALLEEGVDPQTIERAATLAGFPAPPLAMLDEVSLTLSLRIRQAAAEAAERDGVELPEHPGIAVSERMVEELGRRGKAAGAGFYDYPAPGEEAGKRLWPGLCEHFGPAAGGAAGAGRPVAPHPLPLLDIQERYLFRMALETARCFDEGVIDSAAAANIGSIMGIGFPPLYGGTVQYMQGYQNPVDPSRRGLPGLVARAWELAAACGDRFQPPAYLVDLADRGARFPAIASPGAGGGLPGEHGEPPPPMGKSPCPATVLRVQVLLRGRSGLPGVGTNPHGHCTLRPRGASRAAGTPRSAVEPRHVDGGLRATTGVASRHEDRGSHRR
jgi:3-hydroxyacyl-CoA dehydrogenase/enoyl-CoA hydratase/3-hydroxybutyryl-CoA epimerase